MSDKKNTPLDDLSKRGVFLQPSVLAAPLNQSKRDSSSFRHSGILPAVWHHEQAQSDPTLYNAGRLMRDRWWFSFARFIKKEAKVAAQIGQHRALSGSQCEILMGPPSNLDITGERAVRMSGGKNGNQN